MVEKGAFVGMSLTLDEAQFYFTFLMISWENSESLCLTRAILAGRFLTNAYALRESLSLWKPARPSSR